MLNSILLISRGMWEPIGVVFAVSLVWTSIRMIFYGEWRNAIRWCYFAGGIAALLWRLHLHIGGARYHNVFLFIALFCIIDLFETFPLPRMWKRFLFFAGIICCFVHAVMIHPQERKVFQLYQTIQADAAHYPRTLGLTYDLKASTHGYYSRLELYGMDRLQPLPEIVRNLKGNLSVYDGDYDAVYLFFAVKKAEMALLPELDDLMPEKRMRQIGFVWNNRHHKKALVVYRYLPKAGKAEIPVGTLIPNGDFSSALSPAGRQKKIAYFGKSMPRVNNAGFDPPEKWDFYQSLVGRSASFFTRIKEQNGFALHLEANGYLCAISPTIDIPEEKKLSFTIKAEKEALLQISRGVQGKDLYPVVLLPLKAGQKGRYEISLPVYPGEVKSNIWFWLDHGVIDLSDVRMR